MDNVRLLKLVSGEEILAQVQEGIDDEHDTQWTLTNVREVLFTPEGLMLIPFPRTKLASSKLSVRTDHTMFCLMPDERITEAYLKEVGEKTIVTPPTELVLP